MTQEDFERFERLSRPLLRLINRITGMETGFITAIDWSSLRQEVVFALNTADLEVREGTVTGWCDTMCRQMFLSGRAQSDDVPADYPGSAGHKLGMRTYFALPILSGDTVLGTVCGASGRPVRLGPQSLGNIQLVADSLSIQMEAQVDRVALRWRAEQAEALALLDPLTGQANRRAFDSRLEEELARSGRHDEPIALLMIDVDGFKTVNDTYGHTGGDAILVAAGQILQRVARSEDVAARIGGDEFVLLMPHCTAAGAAAAASRIADEFTSATRASHMPCTLSIGVSTSETSRRESLVAVADTALYRIKSLRRSAGARTPAGALGGAR